MKIEMYMCKKCGKKITTERIDIGIIPAIILCPNCKSDMYILSTCKQTIEPDFVWFKPNDAQLFCQVAWEINWLSSKVPFEVALFLQKEFINNDGLLLAPDKETVERWKSVN
ncbi:MAG: hypothetical protein WCY30_02295 [Candidatus Neomarinimicrobiota bacterium]